MYTLTLLLHSWIRWAVFAAGLFAIARAISGLTGRRPWASADHTAGAAFVGLLDLQMLIGLVLYFGLSPITTETMRDMGAAMANDGLRFWAVEHPFGMLVGIALAHVGRGRVKKATDPARKHRTAAIFFVLALIAILVSIPWPGAVQGRPLFRFGL
jgi:hypothetical protein